MKIGVIGSGSWGTAIAKILTDNGQNINWWFRSPQTIDQLIARRHNPHYLPSVHFDITSLTLSSEAESVIKDSEVIILVTPSAYITDLLEPLPSAIFQGKKIVSAIKGIVPGCNYLLNDYLKEKFHFSLTDYFTLLGPCHAEEVAAEKLSYLTVSGVDVDATTEIAENFKTPYLRVLHNTDVYGVQYAAVLKNIYAVGAGIAHGLEYGDNFLSVLIANSADEMAGFLRRTGKKSPQVGTIIHQPRPASAEQDITNYAASVYLGDLLVTCYSLFSRNRTFGNMIGKGYSVKSAQLEMNMVAEGYNASKCMNAINHKVGAEMPIAETIYKILWEKLPAAEGFNGIEAELL